METLQEIFVSYDLRDIEIFNDQEQLLYLFKKKGQLYTLKDNSGKTIYTLKKRAKGFIIVTSFEYVVNEGPEQLQAVFHSWKPRLKLSVQKDNFLTIVHKSNKFSLFKNNNQVALMTKKLFYLGSSSYSYKLTFKSNFTEDLLLLIICSCLTIVSWDKSHSTNDADFNLDLGLIGPEYKSFNPSWL